MANHIPDSEQWYRLDNAARIFSTIITPRTTTVFRISAECRDEVDPEILSKALSNLMPRFPFYQVTLNMGLFWYYFQKHETLPVVLEEQLQPCRRFKKKRDGRLFLRVLYFRKRISLEMSHILTDGTGALVFLKALLCEYFSLKGVQGIEYGSIPVPGTDVPEGEWEDAYRRFYDKTKPYPDLKEKAYHMPGPLLDKDSFRVITGVVSLDQLIMKKDEYNVTVTEFLTSILFESILDYIQSLPPERRKIRPVRIMVPVDLRKFYPSDTMRNFFLTVTPEIDPRLGEYTFDEILKNVHHTLRVEINEKLISKQMRRNVYLEKHPLIRTVPLIIKIPVEKVLYSVFSSAIETCLMTNLGKSELPEALNGLIERLDFLPNPVAETRIGCGVITHGNACSISFGSLLRYTEIEKLFFRKLRKMDIIPKIIAN